MNLSETAWPDVKQLIEKDIDIKAVLVLGSLEQHGHHLPLGTDTMLGYEVWKRVEKLREDVLLLPPVTFGCSEVWRSYPGTICVRPSTLMCLIEDIASSLERHGVRTLLIQIAHGGNAVVAASAAKEYCLKSSGLRIFMFEPFNGVPTGICEGRNAGHACEVETSMGLVVFPNLVHMDKAKTGSIQAWITPRDLAADEYCVNSLGVSGEPEHASKEKGETIIESMCLWRCNWLDGLPKRLSK